MYTNRINLEAIRKIDRIIEAPVQRQQAVVTEMTTAFHGDAAKKSFEDNEFSQEGSAQQAIPKEKQVAMVEEASKALEVVNTELSFRIHEGTNRPLIQLIKKGTDEVVREIPPEKMLDILAGIWEWAGLLVDRKE